MRDNFFFGEENGGGHPFCKDEVFSEHLLHSEVLQLKHMFNTSMITKTMMARNRRLVVDSLESRDCEQKLCTHYNRGSEQKHPLICPSCRMASRDPHE